MSLLHLRPDACHGDWNYSLFPRPRLPADAWCIFPFARVLRLEQARERGTDEHAQRCEFKALFDQRLDECPRFRGPLSRRGLYPPGEGSAEGRFAWPLTSRDCQGSTPRANSTGAIAGCESCIESHEEREARVWQRWIGHIQLQPTLPIVRRRPAVDKRPTGHLADLISPVSSLAGKFGSFRLPGVRAPMGHHIQMATKRN